MKKLTLLTTFLSLFLGIGSAQTGVKIMGKNNGTPVELKPTGGIIADIPRGLLRTAINGGLRGTPGYVWVVNNAGDGQAARIVGGHVMYETTPAGLMPMFVIDIPQTPPQVLQVRTGVVCILVNGVWTVPFNGAIADIVVFRNGLRQNRASGGATDPVNPYEPDYTISTDLKTITYNPNFPWALSRPEADGKPDLIVADVYFY